MAFKNTRRMRERSRRCRKKPKRSTTTSSSREVYKRWKQVSYSTDPVTDGSVDSKFKYCQRRDDGASRAYRNLGRTEYERYTKELARLWWNVPPFMEDSGLRLEASKDKIRPGPVPAGDDLLVLDGYPQPHYTLMILKTAYNIFVHRMKYNIQKNRSPGKRNVWNWGAHKREQEPRWVNIIECNIVQQYMLMLEYIRELAKDIATEMGHKEILTSETPFCVVENTHPLKHLDFREAKHYLPKPYITCSDSETQLRVDKELDRLERAIDKSNKRKMEVTDEPRGSRGSVEDRSSTEESDLSLIDEEALDEPREKSSSILLEMPVELYPSYKDPDSVESLFVDFADLQVLPAPMARRTTYFDEILKRPLYHVDSEDEDSIEYFAERKKGSEESIQKEKDKTETDEESEDLKKRDEDKSDTEEESEESIKKEYQRGSAAFPNKPRSSRRDSISDTRRVKQDRKSKNKNDRGPTRSKDRPGTSQDGWEIEKLSDEENERYTSQWGKRGSRYLQFKKDSKKREDKSETDEESKESIKKEETINNNNFDQDQRGSAAFPNKPRSSRRDSISDTRTVKQDRKSKNKNDRGPTRSKDKPGTSKDDLEIEKLSDEEDEGYTSQWVKRGSSYPQIGKKINESGGLCNILIDSCHGDHFPFMFRRVKRNVQLLTTSTESELVRNEEEIGINNSLITEEAEENASGFVYPSEKETETLSEVAVGLKNLLVNMATLYKKSNYLLDKEDSYLDRIKSVNSNQSIHLGDNGKTNKDNNQKKTSLINLLLLLLFSSIGKNIIDLSNR